MANFKELLTGAYSMDRHLRDAPFERNMPVLLAMLGVWYQNFWGARSHAFLPYDHYLRNFVKHLQQLDMESNGKSVLQDGRPAPCDTGAVVWGGVGCNGQHAYHQLLHQGTQFIPADFIVPVVSYNPLGDHHQWLYANCLSQSQALMLGKTRAEAEAELRAKGLAEAEVQRMNADRSRLAQELDNSEARAERLEEANKEVSRRLVTAMETIRAVLDR